MKPQTTIPITLHNVDGSALDILHEAQVLPLSILLFGSGPCRDIKAAYPQIATLYRKYLTDQGRFWRQGAAGAESWLDAMGDLTGVDYLIGPNEEVSYVATPEQARMSSLGRAPKGAIEGIEEAILYNAFHLELQALMVRRRLSTKLIGFQWPVGGPSKEVLMACVPSTLAIIRSGGLIGIHPYWPRRLVEGQVYYSMRITMLVDWYAEAGVAVGPQHFAVTECGCDVIHSWQGVSGPWRTLVDDQHLTIEQYQTDLEYFGTWLRAQGSRVGAIYSWRGGGQDYEHIDVAPMREWIKALWARHQGTPPPPPPPPVPAVVYAKPGGTYSAVYLRAGPSEAGARVGTARRGTRLVVLGKTGDYFEVAVLVDGVELNTLPPRAWLPFWLVSLTP